MQQHLIHVKDETAVWTWLVSRALTHAISSLSRLAEQELRVKALDVQQYSVAETTTLLGGPENPVMGIYLTIDGDATGHLMLVYELDIAYRLMDIRTGRLAENPSNVLQMELPFIGEMGSIIGSYFLSALADATSLSLTQSPPAVMFDTAGAILDIALSNILSEQDNVLVFNTEFATDAWQVSGQFLVIPAADFLATVLTNSRIR